MRHQVAKRKLNRTTAHRLSMFENMSVSLIEHEQIKTTLPKAKELRSFVEKLITFGKKGDLNYRRIAFAKLRDEEAVKKLFDVLASRYKTRNGGYTRVLKAGFRYGDNSPMAIIELVDRDITAKGKKQLEILNAQKAKSENKETENIKEVSGKAKNAKKSAKSEKAEDAAK